MFIFKSYGWGNKGLRLIGWIGDGIAIIKPKRRGHVIKIEGFVEVWNGKTHIKARNKFVNSGLIMMTNFLCFGGTATASSGRASASYYGGNLTASIRLGSDTTTTTSPAMTSLVAPIGTAPGTAPNTMTCASSNPAPNTWRVTWNASWNAGTVSGTVGEMGLFLNGNASPPTLLSAGTTSDFGSTLQMWSRLSAADGDFTAFTINTSAPLSIAWVVQHSFA